MRPREKSCDGVTDQGRQIIAFISRSGDSKPTAQAFMHELRKFRVTAKAYTCDITDSTKLVETLNQCKAERPTINASVLVVLVWALVPYTMSATLPSLRMKDIELLPISRTS